MKKLILLMVFILAMSFSYGQTTGSYWRVIKWTTAFGQNLPDSTIILVKDSGKFYQIHHVTGVTSAQTMSYAWGQGWVSRIPPNLSGYSISGTGTSSLYKYQLRSDSENEFTIPFTLTSNSLIIYNGVPLQDSQWSGSGTTTLTLSIQTLIYDQLTIKQ